MKNQNIMIAERLCVKQVIIMIRNVKKIKRFAKTKLIFFCFVSLMITVSGEKRSS